jgi:glycosyltransferase involved in cell wall biosynthesis
LHHLGDRIIVPSLSTQDDLVKYGFSKEKIRVIPEAPSPVFKPEKESKIKEIKSKFGIKGKYLISIGINPRKNTERILKAFSMLSNDYTLVLVGEPVFIDVPRRKGVKLIGHVSESDLSVLYSGAEVLVYPSLYEGFGLPVLEAMACGVPVVTSNVSSLPEVAGKACVMVNPFKVDSIARGVNKAIKKKDYLINKGYKRVKKYSWKKTAQKTVAVYKESLKNS